MVTKEEQKKKDEAFLEKIKPPTPQELFNPNLKTSKTGAGEPPSATPDPNQVFRDELGNITAVLKGDKFLPFGDDAESRAFLERQRLKEATPEGAVEARGVRGGLTQQQLLEQIREEDKLTPGQIAKELEGLDIPSNLKSSIAGILAETAAGVATGAGTGAAAGLIAGPGSPVTVPIAAGIGALTGGTAAALRSIKSELKAEAREDSSAVDATFKGARKSMKLIISEVNQGRMDPSEAVRLFRLEQSKINTVERQLKELTRNNINDYLSDGSTKFAKVLEFQSSGGEGEVLELALSGAIQRPDPTKLFIADLEDQGELNE